MDDIDALARRIARHLPRDPPVSDRVALRLRAAREAAVAGRRVRQHRRLLLRAAGLAIGAVLVIKLFN
jgi:hypothetical protein